MIFSAIGDFLHSAVSTAKPSIQIATHSAGGSIAGGMKNGLLTLMV